MNAYQTQQLKYYAEMHKAEMQRLLNIYNHWFSRKS